MKNRGKYVKTEQDKSNLCSDFNYFSCKRHPSSSSSVGICAYCLNEKLIKLVCSDFREQRMSSCSCSDFSSSYRNSSCTFDVGSVGRISFLIENEKNGNGEEQKTLISHMKLKQSETDETEKTEDDGVLLKRSNSCVVEVKKRNGFWKIGKLFTKKRDKDGFSERNKQGFDQKSEVSRSRSLSSFMDGNFDHDMGSMSCSSAKVSDYNEFESRKSGFKGGSMDFESRIIVKENDFRTLADCVDDDDDFIELKIDLMEKSKTEYSVFKKYDPLDLIGDDGMGSSSCRITVNERGIKKVKNNHIKAWKWMFKHHSVKKDLNHILKS